MLKSERLSSRVPRSVFIVFSIFVLFGSLGSVSGSAYSGLSLEPNATVTSPPVFLRAGTAGSSVIYTGNTSAKVTAAAPAPTPTYNASSYNITTGTFVSGSVPASVQTVDTDYFIVRSSGTATSTTAYNPSNATLKGNTTNVSGTTADLALNNGYYMTFRSYDSATSAQTLYAHQETTTIGGSSYYKLMLTSANNTGTSLAASMAATGRQLFGRFVYPLTGVSYIPSSPWTMYYRAWRGTALANIAFDAQSSMVQSTTASSISWNHTTGTGSNRLLLVAVGVHKATGLPTTVTSVTYDGAALTQVTTAVYTSNPQVRTYVFRLVNPTSGTKTIVVNFAGATLSVAGAVTYTGVDQSTPIQTSNTATGSSTAPSVSVTVTGSGRWVFGHLGGHRTASAWTITEGAGQTQRWAQTGQLYKGVGSDKSVSAGSQSMSWSLDQAASFVASAVVINPATLTPVGHVDVDILIRRSDGTVRTTIATNVANSADLTSTNTTLSATYSWSAYNVVNQTDFLEIDYYVEVTTAVSGASAYIIIDDNNLALADQTRATNIMLPSQYTSEVEFTGSSNTEAWNELVWSIDSAWTTGSVAVTIQVYNYTGTGEYPNSGNGYYSYTSNSTAGTDETRTQTITTNPTHFRNGTGYWKIKVKGVKTTTSQFDFKADWVEFKPTYYSQYTVSTEFLFSSMTKNTPTQLNFTVVSEYDIASVFVTIQVWNYSSSPPAYVTSGEGYLTYSSSGSNETKLLSINTNPQFYTSNGNAKIKITGVKTPTTQYQQETNQVALAYSYSSSSNYDYVLKIFNNVTDLWKIRLRAYSQSNITRLDNCTIYFHNSSDGTSGQIYIVNGSYTQQTGLWYDLPASIGIERYIAVTLQASDSVVSYIYVYLEILIPDKTTYAQYVITFEIT